jgi:hypothetical protein
MTPNLKAGACAWGSDAVQRTASRHDWPHYFGLRGDVSRSDVVAWPSEAASNALELVSRFPIFLRAVATRGACLTCAARVDRYDNYASQRRLVGNEAAQLVEGPRLMAAPLTATNRYPITDALEVFKGYSAMGVFRLRDQSLGDGMVYLSAEPCLSTAEFAQMTLCAASPLRLQCASQAMEAKTNFFYRIAGMYNIIAIDSEVFHSEIHTEETYWLHRWGLFFFNNYKQVDGIPTEYHTHLPSANSRCKSCPLEVSEEQWQYDAPLQSQKTYRIVSLPRQISLVIGNGAVFTKYRFDCLIALVGPANFGDAAYCHLSRQRKLRTQVGIHNFVEAEIIADAFPEGDICRVVTGGIERKHCSADGSELFRRYRRLKHHRPLHSQDHCASKDKANSIAPLGLKPTGVPSGAIQ